MPDRSSLFREDDSVDCHLQTLTCSHIPQLVELERTCFACPWTAREFELCLGQDHFHALGIVQRNTIVAYLTFFILVDEIEIVNLAVREDRRRCGWGQRLLADLMQLVRDRGLERIVLEVRSSNQIAQRLYAKNGFGIVGVRKGYYPPHGEDALVMAWSPAQECNGGPVSENTI
jgi:ribosomal-protein-alanine N-acetyltransferase